MAKKDELPTNERRGRKRATEADGAGPPEESTNTEEQAGLHEEEDTADEEPSNEHTSIDASLLDRLRAQLTPPDALEQVRSKPEIVLSNDPNLVGGSSTSIDNVEAMLDLPSRPGSSAAPKRTGTLILDSSPFAGAGPEEESSGLANLGPAFPDVTPDEPRPSEVPTTAKPSNAPTYSDSGPELPSKPSRSGRSGPGSSPGAEPDAWDGFEDRGDSWSKSDSANISGERELKARSPKPGLAKIDTNVYKRGGKAKAEEGARLVALDGEAVELPIEGEDVSLGRESDNDLVIKDPSVSRKHARIVCVAGCYELIDLQSGNGTFVNGKRVAERERINSGDEVRFGNLSFRFLELGDVFKPVDASGAPVLPGARGSLWSRLRDNPRARVFLASGVLVLATLVVASVLFMKRNEHDPVRQAQVFNAYLKGVEQFKQRRWSAAESYLMAALKLQPDHERSRKYLEAIAVEKRAELALKEARAAHSAGDLGRAYQAALGTEDSVHFASDGDALLRSIELTADKRIDAAREALAQGSREEAAKHLQSLEFFEAYRAGLRDLRAQAGLGAAVEPGPRPEGARSDGRDKKPEEPKGEAPREIKVVATGPHADVITLFAEGKVQEALRKIERSNDREAKALEAKMRKFADVYDSALREHQGKRYNSAIKLLTEAQGYEEKVTGGRSKLAYDVRDKLADVYYLRGVVEFSQQQYAEAYRDFKTAMQSSANHAQSSRMLGQLESQAEQAYRAAYAKSESSPADAREQYRLVMKMVPPTHELYRKAKERLDALK